jgi:hypothetical protein
MSNMAWTFRQLGGERKTLVLDGWAAPFGRPRQQPVVRDAIKIRQQTTRYPDGNGPPTRHVFGVDFIEWTLTGRWMDRDLGNGGAQERVRAMKAFVRDQQPVMVTWGKLLSVTGFIEEFDPGRESANEVAWRMVLLVDEDLDQWTAPRPAQPPIYRQMNLILDHVESMTAPWRAPKPPRGFSFSLLDRLDDAVSLVTGTLGQFGRMVGELKSFEKATLGQIRRLRAGIRQLHTALVMFNGLASSLQNDALALRADMHSDLRMRSWLTEADIHTSVSLAELERMDRAARLQERGSSAVSVVAHPGDSWESIATARYGGPDRADDLRKANGIRYGEQPRPGKRYVVPLVV